jgi:hypothetical protein
MSPLLLLAALTTEAAAYMPADTPCDAAVSTISMRHVLVNGVPVQVSGPGPKGAFDMWAARCRPQAVPHFRQWRSRRQAANWSGAGGLILWPVWAVTVWSSLDAQNARNALDAALAEGAD